MNEWQGDEQIRDIMYDNGLGTFGILRGTFLWICPVSIGRARLELVRG